MGNQYYVNPKLKLYQNKNGSNQEPFLYILKSINDLSLLFFGYFTDNFKIHFGFHFFMKIN